ncbi:MAG: NTF2 fold immunity protein [Stellaceae bacterium]
MPNDPQKPFAVASGETMLFMTQITRGGIVFSQELAMEIAELLCEAHFGKEELARQKPFSITDQNTYWQINGSWNSGGKTTKPGGPFFIRIEKHDGRITDFGMSFPYEAHPSVVPIISAHLGRKTPANK